MKSKRKPSLKLILTISFLIFSLILLVTLWFFQTVFLEEFYKGIKTAQVKNCGAAITDNIESEELDDLISDIEEQNTMFVSVYTVEEQQLCAQYQSGDKIRFDTRISQEIAFNYYKQAKQNNGEYSQITQRGQERKFEMRQSDDMNGFDNKRATADQIMPGDRNNREPSLERVNVETLAYAKTVETDSKTYFVVIESEITPVTSVVDTLRIQLLIVTAVIVIISIGVAIVTAMRIAKPIADTNAKAKKLAQQKYDVRFAQDGYKEVAELNSTLNFAAEELGKVDKLRRELIANISHDLRTPLTMITGYSEVMRDLPGEVTPENLQIIIDESNHLNSLVSDLLDISRLESGTAEMTIEPFSLTRCIENIFERYTKLIEVDGFSIRFEQDREVFVRGDEMRITQVLYNLINNAVNYVGEDKTVIVRQTVKTSRVRVDVIDHGEGIPQEKLEYIWDRYYRVDTEHKQAKIGTGLGLSIVKNILKAHNATYGVESEIGKGSDFYFEMECIYTDEER